MKKCCSEAAARGQRSSPLSPSVRGLFFCFLLLLLLLLCVLQTNTRCCERTATEEQSNVPLTLFREANLLTDGYNEIKPLNRPCMPRVMRVRTFPSPHSAHFGENPFPVSCATRLTSTVGLLGGSSPTASSSSACFPLSFFFFFFFTGSSFSTVDSSAPQKEEKEKAGCQLRKQKEKLCEA